MRVGNRDGTGRCKLRSWLGGAVFVSPSTTRFCSLAASHLILTAWDLPTNASQISKNLNHFFVGGFSISQNFFEIETLYQFFLAIRGQLTEGFMMTSKDTEQFITILVSLLPHLQLHLK